MPDTLTKTKFETKNAIDKKRFSFFVKHFLLSILKQKPDKNTLLIFVSNNIFVFVRSG